MDYATSVRPSGMGYLRPSGIISPTIYRIAASCKSSDAVLKGLQGLYKFFQLSQLYVAHNSTVGEACADYSPL